VSRGSRKKSGRRSRSWLEALGRSVPALSAFGIANALTLLRIAAGKEVLWIQDQLGFLTVKAVFMVPYTPLEALALFLLSNSITALIIWGARRAGLWKNCSRN